MKQLRFSSALAAFLLTLPTTVLVAAPVLLTPAPVQAKDNLSVGTLLTGLMKVDADNFNVYTDFNTLLDVRFALKENQIDALTNAIAGNPKASYNQAVLTEKLRAVGILWDDQIVVGCVGSTIYIEQLVN